MTDQTRGVLYPERLPRFTRVAPTPPAAPAAPSGGGPPAPPSGGPPAPSGPAGGNKPMSMADAIAAKAAGGGLKSAAEPRPAGGGGGGGDLLSELSNRVKKRPVRCSCLAACWLLLLC